MTQRRKSTLAAEQRERGKVPDENQTAEGDMVNDLSPEFLDDDLEPEPVETEEPREEHGGLEEDRRRLAYLF